MPAPTLFACMEGVRKRRGCAPLNLIIHSMFASKDLKDIDLDVSNLIIVLILTMMNLAKLVLK